MQKLFVKIETESHTSIFIPFGKELYVPFLYPYLTRKYIFTCSNTDTRQQERQQIYPLSTRPIINVIIHESRKCNIHKSSSLLSE